MGHSYGIDNCEHRHSQTMQPRRAGCQARPADSCWLPWRLHQAHQALLTETRPEPLVGYLAVHHPLAPQATWLATAAGRQRPQPTQQQLASCATASCAKTMHCWASRPHHAAQQHCHMGGHSAQLATCWSPPAPAWQQLAQLHNCAAQSYCAAGCHNSVTDDNASSGRSCVPGQQACSPR